MPAGQLPPAAPAPRNCGQTKFRWHRTGRQRDDDRLRQQAAGEWDKGQQVMPIEEPLSRLPPAKVGVKNGLVAQCYQGLRTAADVVDYLAFDRVKGKHRAAPSEPL